MYGIKRGYLLCPRPVATASLLTAGKLLGADEFSEKVLGHMRLLVCVGEPVAEPEAKRPRLLRVQARIPADQEHTELELQLCGLYLGLLVLHRVLVDDDARVVAARHVHPLVYPLDQLPLHQDYRRSGCLSTRRHHDLLLLLRHGQV